MDNILVLNQDEVRQCLSMTQAIEAVKTAYSAFSAGRVDMPPVQHLDVHQFNGEIDIKSSYVEDFGLYNWLRRIAENQFELKLLFDAIHLLMY